MVGIYMIVLQIEIYRDYSGRTARTDCGDDQQRLPTEVISDKHRNNGKYNLYDAQYHGQILALQITIRLIENDVSILQHCLKTGHLLNYAQARYYY